MAEFSIIVKNHHKNAKYEECVSHIYSFPGCTQLVARTIEGILPMIDSDIIHLFKGLFLATYQESHLPVSF